MKIDRLITFGRIYMACLLKGTWQWGGFSGVFAEIGSSRVPYTTFRAVPILASNSRRYSYSKNDSPLSPMRGVAISLSWGVDDSPHHWYAESATPRAIDTESRLLNFFKRKLSVSMIRRVIDSPHQWYGESVTLRIVESESRRLPAPVIRRVDDSAYRWVGESTTQRIGDTGSRYSKKKLFSFDFQYLKRLKHAFKGSIWPKISPGCNVLSQ